MSGHCFEVGHLGANAVVICHPHGELPGQFISVDSHGCIFTRRRLRQPPGDAPGCDAMPIAADLDHVAIALEQRAHAWARYVRDLGGGPARDWPRLRLPKFSSRMMKVEVCSSPTTSA